MSETAVTVLGFAAAVLTTGAFLPQAWKTFKTRSARDLSLNMFLMLNAGIALWLVYGICIGQWPVIIANAVGLANAALILGFKLRFG